MRYFLGRDDSCHWFLIPVERRDDWEAWVEQLTESNDPDWDTPSYAKRIDGYHRLTFTDPIEE